MHDWLPIEIAGSAMAAQRMRMNALASNMANVNSTRMEDGQPYKPLEVIFKSEMPKSFESFLEKQLDKNVGQEFASEDKAMLERHLRGVQAEIVESTKQPELRYMPEHPHADAKGMVAFPAISAIEQMTNMIAASRMYDANAATIKMTKDMLEDVLSLMRG